MDDKFRHHHNDNDTAAATTTSATSSSSPTSTSSSTSSGGSTKAGLFSSNTNCPVPAGFEQYTVHGTAHKAMLYVAVGCMAVTIISSVALIFMHLRRYRRPQEQRQIIRLISVTAVFAIISFFEVLNYSTAQQIDPLSELYEAFCLCALYLLFIEFTSRSNEFDESPDSSSSGIDKRSHDVPGAIGWLMVFQYPILELIALVVLEVTVAVGDYCPSSLKPEFGHLWVQIIRTVGVVLAVMTIFRYYTSHKSDMKARRGFAKLLCFKAIVFIHFIQAWIFNILVDKDVLKTSSDFSYGDWLYGLPNVLTCAEMVIFSASFWYAYSSSEYSSSSRSQGHALGFGSAIADALNPMDLLRGFGQGFRGLSQVRTTRASGNGRTVKYQPVHGAGMVDKNRDAERYDSGQHMLERDNGNTAFPRPVG